MTYNMKNVNRNQSLAFSMETKRLISQERVNEVLGFELKRETKTYIKKRFGWTLEE